jgi:type III pantothenate kinase
MFIAIDIGNSNTAIGVYEKETLKTEFSIPSIPQKSENETGKIFAALLSGKEISGKKIDGIGISSVVPELTGIYSAASKKYFHREALVINTKLNLGMRVHYDNPESLGTDRLCSAVSGYSKYGGPLIIIDFGTATTYGVIASNGDFLGGVISPGIATMSNALHQHTAQLPDIEINFPGTVIGRNTVACIQSGVIYGALDSLTGMIDRLQTEIQKYESEKAAVIGTGGLSKFIYEHTKLIGHLEPFLVLEGIRLIYKRVNQ